MAIETIKIESHEQWLKDRSKDITSTEISALYGLSPYLSEFELYHNKKDNVIVRIKPNERMRWGTRLESAIAYGAAEDQGWDISKLNVYMRDTEARIGSSFDFKINSTANGAGIMEIKNVDRLQYMKSWVDDGEGNIEAPEHIELQIQHQMEVSGYEWTALVALVGGNEQKIILRNRDREIGKDIRQRVSAFWEQVKNNTAPSPDYSVDAEFIIKQLRAESEPDLVLESNADLDQLIEQYNFLSASVKSQNALKDSTKAQILERIGKASKVISPLGTISCGTVKGSAGTLITPDMLGTYIGAREGYRSFRFNAKKEK
jgi:putative phage-type endonuclease